MAQVQDLGILGCLSAAEQYQLAEDPDHDQVEQARRAWPGPPSRSSAWVAAVQHRHLVTQDQDLGVLRHSSAARER